VDGWPANVLGGVGADPAVEVGESVVAAHGRQPPVDRRRSQAAGLHICPVQLDVRSGRFERSHADGVGPLQVLAQVSPIELQGTSVVAGQEGGRGELSLVEEWLVSAHNQRGRR